MPQIDHDTLTSTITEKDFALPKPAIPHDSLLAPPISSLGRALQSLHMGSQGQDATGHTLSDTPLGSAPSTAPGSPRLYVLYNSYFVDFLERNSGDQFFFFESCMRCAGTASACLGVNRNSRPLLTNF
jgi:hypothetical protein